MLKNKHISKILFLICFYSLFSLDLFCQSHVSTQSHQSSVTDLKFLQNGSESSFFSAGNDGFLVKWTEDGLGEHYQISDLSIKMIARSPKGNDIAVYETDGASLNRVSV